MAPKTIAHPNLALSKVVWHAHRFGQRLCCELTDVDRGKKPFFVNL